MSFNAIRENKILAKISGFTVVCESVIDVAKRQSSVLRLQLPKLVTVLACCKL